MSKTMSHRFFPLSCRLAPMSDLGQVTTAVYRHTAYAAAQPNTKND